jgi:hypothetical protein
VIFKKKKKKEKPQTNSLAHVAQTNVQHIFYFSQYILILSTSCTKVLKAITVQQAYCTVMPCLHIATMVNLN